MSNIRSSRKRCGTLACFPTGNLMEETIAYGQQCNGVTMGIHEFDFDIIPGVYLNNHPNISLL